MEQSELLAVIEQAAKDESSELNLYKLDHLPPEIGNLPHLSRLDLVDNSLTTLPVEIGGLRSLTGLHLSHNRYLTSLPREIFDLTSSRELSLPGHDTAVPPEISNSANLEELYIGHGPLKTLPPLYKLGSFNLGTWVSDVKRRPPNDPEYSAKLEALPGWEWNVPQ